MTSILRSLFTILFLYVTPSLHAQGLHEPVFMDQAPGYPDADELLQNVRDRLPAAPLQVGARLQAKDRNGKVLRVLFAEMDLHWGERPSWAQYVLRDHFGKQSDQLTVRWPMGGEPVFDYAAGDPPEAAPVPDLSEAIEGMDLSWSDLTLSFLWWRGGETIGAETKKGRFCYILDVPAPEGSSERYTKVHLWIDPDVAVMLQANAYKEETLVRSLKVKSFKKIDGIWTLKDLDVYSYPEKSKTTLRVQELRGPAVETETDEQQALSQDHP